MGGNSSSTADVQGPPASAGQTGILKQAIEQYPILANLNLSHVTTPMPGDDRMLEFWPPGEPGDSQFPRPSELPTNGIGLQFISPDTTPKDVAADVVSHYLVNADPTLSAEYKKFSDSFNTPAGQDRLRQDYSYARANEGERRPMNEWAKTTRIPDYLRGYTFQQWPEKSYSQMYTPDQIKIMDQIKAYLQKK